MDEDDIPPWLGERFRDDFRQIFRNQYEAELLDAPADQENSNVND